MKGQIVLVSGLFLAVLALSGCTFAGQPDGGVYKSTNGGESFEQKVRISDEANIGSVNVLSMAIDPQNTQIIYIGTDQSGIFRSTNGGDSWVRDINNFMNVHSIVIDPFNSQTIYIAASRGGRGKILKTTTGGESWEEIFTEKLDGPLVLSLALDRSNPNVLYAGDTKGGVYRTEDGGTTWANIYWGKSSVRKIAIDSAASSTIYLGTVSSGALKSIDRGANFSQVVIPGQTGSGGYVYNLIAHPSRGGVVFLSNAGGLYKSVDSGNTWQAISTLVKPAEVQSRGLAVNPQNENEIYFASGKAFYKTTNGGQTWTPVQFNTSRTIGTIQIDPANTSTVYIGMTGAESSFRLLPF